jgi:FMN reductase
MSREIVFVTGSPSASSRSSFVAAAVGERVKRAGFALRVFGVRDFDPSELLLGQSSGATTKAFVEVVTASAAIVLSTPVYKATYSGALKSIVDLIPPDALVGKPALGIATTRLEAHGLEADRAYRALFAFFRARPIDGLVVLDDELQWSDGQGTLSPAANERLETVARGLVEASGEKTRAPALA